MKLILIGVCGGLALTSAGLLLYTQAQRPKVRSAEIIEGAPRHPVTPEMTSATGSKSLKVAPAFEVKDTEGNTVTIASPSAERPQFVYFVLDGCPCSFEAEPLFHDLAKRYEGKVDFVSVTDAGIDKAKKWNVQMLVPYPIIPDPDKEIIRAYEAKNSVYSALISREGNIIKMWPGYSVGILKEMNEMMAKEAGVPVEEFDTKYAPLEESSGCAF